jgi:hypothetical protein
MTDLELAELRVDIDRNARIAGVLAFASVWISGLALSVALAKLVRRLLF